MTIDKWFENQTGSQQESKLSNNPNPFMVDHDTFTL